MRHEFFGPKRPDTDLLEAPTSHVEKIAIECTEGVPSCPDMLSEVLDVPLVFGQKHRRRREQEFRKKCRIEELAGQNVVAA